jgi:putative heme-binding domain-containing protein
LHHVVRHAAIDRLPQAYAMALACDEGLGAKDRAELVRAVGRAVEERGAAVPLEIADWARRLTAELLSSDNEDEARAGLELARDFRPDVFDTVAVAAGTGARFAGLRTAAMDACAGYDAARAIPLLAGILASASEPANLRQHAAGLLGRINNDAARRELLAALVAAPEQVAIAIGAALSDSAEGGERLLATVESGKASPRLLQEKAVANRLRLRNLARFEDRLIKLTSSLPAADERIGRLIAERRKLVAKGDADASQGAKVFEKHCAACHKIAERGTKIGPNLDGIGIRGADRLLEDILDPNRNVDQAFRTSQVVTADGRSLVGLALREEGKILVLADNQGKEIRVPLDEIDERAESQLSVMPANVPDLMSEQEFADLVSYLLEQRVPPK